MNKHYQITHWFWACSQVCPPCRLTAPRTWVHHSLGTGNVPQVRVWAWRQHRTRLWKALFWSQSSHWLALQPWESQWVFVGLSFLTCKMGNNTHALCTSEGWCENRAPTSAFRKTMNHHLPEFLNNANTVAPHDFRTVSPLWGLQTLFFPPACWQNELSSSHICAVDTLELHWIWPVVLGQTALSALFSVPAFWDHAEFDWNPSQYIICDTLIHVIYTVHLLVPQCILSFLIKMWTKIGPSRLASLQ